MEKAKVPEVEQPEKKAVDLIPEARLVEILDILLPWGYSHHDKSKYIGVSPYIGSTTNIITIVANDPEGWGSLFAICMDRFTEDEDETNSLGYYKGIMKLIAPELVCNDEEFKGVLNVLDFDWADENVLGNRFPAKVSWEPKKCMYSNDNYTDEERNVFCDGCKEECELRQKPEWIEEDEKTINNICHIIRQYDKISKKENQPCWYIGDCLLWMQNIKNKVVPQPKQEWSEEDERICHSLIIDLSNAQTDDEDVQRELNKEINWLKSIRHQSQWKPSEEQIEALDFAVDCIVWEEFCIKRKVLKGLLEQLKKL